MINVINMVKVSILGSTGSVGKNVAFSLARENTIDDIVMFSRPSSIEKVKGEVLDMYDALAAEEIDCRLCPSCDFDDIKGSDIVIITAGIPRKKGMDRIDLAVPNAKMVYEYAEKTAIYAPDSVMLVVTNPVDVMTHVALKASGFNKSRVIGLGNHLDSLRLKAIISSRLNVNSGEVHTRVVGEHGNHMVPLLSSTTIGGIPLEYFSNIQDLTVPSLLAILKNAGGNIIGKKGATEYGPAYAISNLTSTIAKDSHKILSVSIYLEGEVEDVHDVCLGVPVVLTKNGVGMIVPIQMNDYEREEFHKAAEAVKETTTNVFNILEME